MADTVVLNNVEMSVADFKRAYEKLFPPTPPKPIDNLTQVVSNSGCGVVIYGSAQKCYVQGLNGHLGHGRITGLLTVIRDDGCGFTYDTEAQLLETWKPA